jgi:5-dehydro-2-deoxygluconokinase
VLVATRDERTRVEPVPVEVVCGLGAGDAFGGALCHGLLSGVDPVEAVKFANAAGAIVASRLLCADAMPTAAEVDELLVGT